MTLATDSRDPGAGVWYKFFIKILTCGRPKKLKLHCGLGLLPVSYARDPWPWSSIDISDGEPIVAESNGLYR